jgi:hypothetical protein
MPRRRAREQLLDLHSVDRCRGMPEAGTAGAGHVLDHHDRTPRARVDRTEVADRRFDLERRPNVRVEARLAGDQPTETEHEPLRDRRRALDE